jgi:nucleoside-diphosphate-sugar epimerase
VETTLKELDWKPEIGIREGVRKYLEWYVKSNG